MVASFETLMAIRHKVTDCIPLSGDESLQWESWIIYCRSREKAVFDDADLLDYATYEARVMIAWINFNRRYFGKDGTDIIDNEPTRTSINWKRAATIAAMILLTFGATSQLLRLLSGNQQTATVTQPVKPVTGNFGKVTEVMLPDSTKVFLFPAASIRYDSIFQKDRRVVELTGEAYFEVHENSSKSPFIVKTGDMVTEVVGTEFNLSDGWTTGTQTISVAKGSVKVTRKDISNLLTKNDQLIWYGSYQQKQRKANWTTTLAWKKEEFHFDDMPLAEIIDVLQRWYGVEIRCRDGQSTDRFTLPMMPRSWPIQKVLEAFKGTRTIDYQITNMNDRQVIILHRLTI